MDEKVRAQALPRPTPALAECASGASFLSGHPSGSAEPTLSARVGAEPPSELQGWVPELEESLTLAQVIDLAFDYRGNVTVVKIDGAEVQGYLFNRNDNVSEPFIQMFDLAGNGPFKLLYSEIRNIKFTGKDMAAGKSWAAWLERKEKENSGEGGGDSHHHRG